MVGEIRQEVQTTLAAAKKEQATKSKKKDDEYKNLKTEFEGA